MVAICVCWNFMLMKDGPVNQMIMALGINFNKSWTADSTMAMWAIILVSVWRSMGYYMVIYLAALQGVPRELYEAATVDGANKWQQFRNVTLPQIKPTTFFCTIMLVIGSFKIYDTVAIMTNGGPGRATKMLVTYIYDVAFNNIKYGQASAIAMVLLVIVLIVTIIQFANEKNTMSQTAVVTHQKAIRKDNPVMKVIGRVLLYTVLIAMALFTLIPFVWMLSSSLKLDQEVFQYPIRWIPETFHWENYRVIWERVSLLTYFKNTAIIALAVTFLQTLTSSFAAYAFAKLRFKGRDLLFVAYIATIAVPWQAYMLPQFIMMRSMGLYDTLLAMIVLQAFSAFGVFLMRQFYQGIPTELCEAARIDGLSEYGIWAKIMLPLSTAAIATLVIFTFVGTWNDYMGPMIYLTRDENKTIQVGLRRFIQEYTSDYHLIMAASLVSLLPVSVVFLCLQKYFIEGIATSGLKG